MCISHPKSLFPLSWHQSELTHTVVCVLRVFGWQIYSMQCQRSMLTINQQENIIIISTPHMEFGNTLSQKQSPLRCTLSQTISKPHADLFYYACQSCIVFDWVCVLPRIYVDSSEVFWDAASALLTVCQTLFRMVKLLIIYLAETLVTQRLIYPIQDELLKGCSFVIQEI